MREIDPRLVDQAVATIRTLAIDGVEKAQSGHPGAPMGLAQIAFEIWMRELRYDPSEPAWPDRDRFVLSCGHASMLLYAMLHLAGYDLPLDELRRFRQWGSRTPGHPEAHLTPGVETTTGPLGQGISNAVGMALALQMLGARVNRPGSDLVAARVFGIASDGDLMEGVSGEASSLAGHLGLDNLVFFYDDNHVTIDGDTALAFSEDVGRRYEAYGWHVQRIDGHDAAQIRDALGRAVAHRGQPSLVVARTHIAVGAPTKQDSSKAHGEPLGEAEVRGVKERLGWPVDATFRVPDEVRALFAARARDGARAREAWQRTLDGVLRQGGDRADAWRRLAGRDVPEGLFEELVRAAPAKDGATRAHAGAIQQVAARLVPSLVGGSADLTPSTKTWIEGSPAVQKGRFEGRNLHFGIREHAMGAVMNGMALAGGFLPYGSTFLVFADYARPAIRLAAIGRLPCVFVFTHDSVFLGEDGPTHQPVEHLWALRVIPNLDVVRPCDALECAAAWAHALARRDGPTVLALTRQKVPNLPRPAAFDPRAMLRGAYPIAEAAGGAPTLVVVATGSEVAPSVGAKNLLEADGERVRVVSAPCWNAFEREPRDWRDAVLPPGVPRAVVEAGVTHPWRSVAGEGGLVVGIDRFGASAPDTVIAKEFGFTAEAIAARVRAWRKERVG